MATSSKGGMFSEIILAELALLLLANYLSFIRFAILGLSEFASHCFNTGSSHSFFCTICEVGFAFKSRYEKHIQSSRHQYLSTMMQPDPNEQSLTEVNLPEYTAGDYHEFQTVTFYFLFPLLGDNYLA